MPKAKKPKVKLKVKKIKKIKPAKKVKVLAVKKIKLTKKKIVKKVVAKKKVIKKPIKKVIAKKVALKKIPVKKPVKKIVIAKTSPKRKKVSKKAEVSEFPAESLFKARIKVIGIGGGGGSIVSEIGRSLEKANFVVADTDIRALKKKSGIKYFWFGQELTHGLGTGVNVDLAKQAAESAKGKLSGIFKDQDIIIFIASLGGGLGSGATQVFAEAAREFGGITFGIFTMPFKFEGKNKLRIAQNALKTLKQSLNVSLVIPNEKIFKIIDANTPITDAFSTVNKSLIESLESLIDLIYNPGIINIDFADLRTILRGRGNTAFLNTVEESGKDRAEKLCQKVLVNPLLQNSSFDAEKILFNIAGSDNLSMFEVEKISSHISNLNPKAKIIFGISKSAKLKNKIKTTVLMTGGSVKEEILPEMPEITEIIKTEVVKELKKESKVSDKKEKMAPVGFKIEETQERVKVARVKKDKQKPKLKTKAKAKAKVKAKIKKPVVKDKVEDKKIEQKPAPFLPAPTIETQVPVAVTLDEKRLNITETIPMSAKKTIRRSGLEIRKAEEQEEKKKIAQEKEWEIPAFLRRVKYKN